MTSSCGGKLEKAASRTAIWLTYLVQELRVWKCAPGAPLSCVASRKINSLERLGFNRHFYPKPLRLFGLHVLMRCMEKNHMRDSSDVTGAAVQVRLKGPLFAELENWRRT